MQVKPILIMRKVKNLLLPTGKTIKERTQSYNEISAMPATPSDRRKFFFSLQTCFLGIKSPKT
jgi:hypothetical protein